MQNKPGRVGILYTSEMRWSGGIPFFFVFVFLNSLPVFGAQPTALFLLDAQPNIRQYSMGGVFSAVNTGDAASNPWELGYAVNPSAYFAHWSGMVSESQYSFASIVFPYKRVGGFSFSYLNYGTGSEIFEELDGTSRTIQLESNKVFSLGYGRNIGERFFVGGSLKYLTSSLAEQYSASTLLKDLGAVYRSLDDKNSFGAAIVNSGTGLKYYQTLEPVPTEIRLGYSRKFRPASRQKIVGGVGYANSSVAKTYSAGAEWFPNIPFVSVRAGASRRDGETRLTAGLGFNYSSFEIDAGYDLSAAKIEDGQSPLRFALRWEFGSKGEYFAAQKYSARGMKDKSLALLEDIRLGEPQYAQAQDDIKSAYPPALVVTASDIRLSPGKAGNLVITLSNNGRGRTGRIDTLVTPVDSKSALSNLVIGAYNGSFDGLEPGQSKSFDIPIKANPISERKNIGFRIEVSEARGFSPTPKTFNVVLAGFSLAQVEKDTSTLSELIKAVSSDNPEIRMIAIEALGDLGAVAKEAGPTLANALSKSLGSECASIARALGNVEPGFDEIAELIKIVDSNQYKDCAFAAADSLAKIGPQAKEVVPALIRNLCANERAGGALATLGSAAVPAVKNVLKDESECRRAHAASVLGAIGPDAKDAVSALMSMLDDVGADVASSSLDALVKIGQASIPFLAQRLDKTEVFKGSALVAGLTSLSPEHASLKKYAAREEAARKKQRLEAEKAREKARQERDGQCGAAYLLIQSLGNPNFQQQALMTGGLKGLQDLANNTTQKWRKFDCDNWLLSH